MLLLHMLALSRLVITVVFRLHILNIKRMFAIIGGEYSTEEANLHMEKIEFVGLETERLLLTPIARSDGEFMLRHF